MAREPDSWVLLRDNASVRYAAVVTAFLHKNKLQRCTVVAKFNTLLLLFVSTVQIKDGRKALCHDVSICKRQRRERPFDAFLLAVEILVSPQKEYVSNEVKYFPR